MYGFFLFLFGAAIGSFLNVVDLRYDGDHFVFDANVLGGRSHCPHCKKTLHWFELFPIVSFFVQGGKCRGCRVPISFQYPLVEIVSGLIFLFVPLHFMPLYGGLAGIAFIALWVIAFEILLLVALIDFKLGIIPDELNIALGVIGIFTMIIAAGNFGAGNNSFLGPYAAVFGAQSAIWISRLVGALAGGLFFGSLVLVTRGKGMGMGDVKFAIALGLLFGWPDIALLSCFAFILGAIVGLSFIGFGKKTMKGSIPFGPFLVIGAAIVFFFGMPIVGSYFSLIGV